ncbi:MAG: Ni/Fe hydrogenase subunit alpha [Fimbriimonadaceae bacterium]|nr:Ni/Fe hydrogenase subunit alpha [Fimbriimonadaceae bacterium]
MATKYIVEPVTRIEGHAKITCVVDDAGKVDHARFHVVEFRGFEKFCEGRHFSEMPTLTERICGICPVSHHLASAKAIDRLAGVQPTRTAALLRELMHMGQVAQSHALSFFHLSSPDLLLGPDSDPALRNVVGIVQAFPEVGLRAVKMRKWGQEVIAAIGGRKIHPNCAVPGGMAAGISKDVGRDLLAEAETHLATAMIGLDLLLGWVKKNPEVVARFAVFSSYYGGLVNPAGGLELYDGNFRISDPQGQPVVDQFDTQKYLDIIGERVESWTTLKFPYYKPAGYPDGAYRVGPLGRLNNISHIPTPRAQEQFEKYKAAGNEHGVVEGTLFYHYARLIEAIYAIERAQQILADDEVYGPDLMAPTTGQLNPRGVGVIEAPRGTLWHDYTIDENGALTNVNLIVSTGQNNPAMCKSVELVAQEFVDGSNVTEGMLNRLEMAIRAHDPCLSCSTHAIGQMPLLVELVDRHGTLLQRIERH